MDDFNSLLADANKGARLWEERFRSDEEYRKNCEHFAAERDRLIEIAQRYLSNIDQLNREYDAAAVRTEYASGCRYMHRGYYCPSLIQDIIVVNMRRGKLLKRLSSRSRSYWAYGYNADGQLIRCESFMPLSNPDRDGLCQATRELLFYEDDRLFGLTVESSCGIGAISEEIFRDGKLVSYTYMPCTFLNGVIEGCKISSERYTYDGEAMHATWHQLTPPVKGTSEFAERISFTPCSVPIYHQDMYSFLRQDGRLIQAE